MTEKRSLERQIKGCQVRGECQKTDIDGKAYCVLLLPEDLRKSTDCPYRGEIAEFHKRGGFGLTYSISFYSCNLEIKKLVTLK